MEVEISYDSSMNFTRNIYVHLSLIMSHFISLNICITFSEHRKKEQHVSVIVSISFSISHWFQWPGWKQPKPPRNVWIHKAWGILVAPTRSLPPSALRFGTKNNRKGDNQMIGSHRKEVITQTNVQKNSTWEAKIVHGQHHPDRDAKRKKGRNQSGK